MAARENIREQLRNIMDISEELDLPYEDFDIPTHDLENVEALFEVLDHEVQVPRI